MRKKSLFTKDVLPIALFAFLILLFSHGSSSANPENAPGLPLPPAAIIFRNPGALPVLLPAPKARRDAGDMTELPPIKPLGIDWIFTADLAMRSA